MAMSSGQNEVSTIHVRGVSEGIQDVIKDLRSLGQQLVSVDKQLSKSIKTEKLKKDLTDITNEFTKIASSAAKGTAPAGNSVDNLTAKVRVLQKELKNAQKTSAVGLQTGAKASDVKAYKEVMAAVGTPVVGNPESFAMLRKNMRNFRKDLDDTSKSGIASRDSLRAVTGEGGIAFMEPATKAEKFNATLRVLQGNLAGLSAQMTNQAKNTQWMGRQMMEGITLPIVGLGTMAVRSFTAVSGEMIQLKKVTEFGADYVKLEKSIRGVSREFGVSRKSATALFKDIAALGVEGEDNIAKFADSVSQIAMVGDTDTTTAMQFFRTMNAVFAEGNTSQKGLENTTELMAQMSAVADETSLQLSDLAQAFPEVAPVMKQMGFTAGGTAAALAGMYKAGIPASEAAHALKFSLQRLVNPTKKSSDLINEIGFSLFDASGATQDADMHIMSLGKSLRGMSAEAQSQALGNLFGNRQTARMQTFFTDVERGRQELESLNTGAATLDGRIITDATQLTSDYARGLVASGMAAGAAVSPMDRYTKAAEEIKKDPSVAIKRMKSAFDDIKVQLGAAITPAFLVLGDKLVTLLDTFMKSPKAFQIMVLGFAGILAALGPIIYIFAQAKHAVSAFVRVASFALPKMGTITPGVAEGFMSQGSRGFLGHGDKVIPLSKGKERRRMKRGALTDLEKAAQEERKTPEIVTESIVTKELAAANELLATTEKNLAASTQASVVAIEEKTIAIAKASAAETTAATKSAAAQATANKTTATSAVTNAVNPKAGLGPFAAYGAAAEAGAAVEASKVNKAAGLGPAMTGKSPLLEKNLTPYERYMALIKKTQLEQSRLNSTMDDSVNKTKKMDLSDNPWQKAARQVKKLEEAEKARIAALPPPPSPKGASNYKKIGDSAKKASVGVGHFATGTMKIEKGGAVGAIGKIVNGFMKFNVITLVISLVIGLVAALVVAFKSLGKNGDQIRKQIEPSMKKIGAAVDKVKEAISGIVEKLKGVFAQLGSGSKGAEKAGSSLVGVGGIISMALDLVAAGIELVAKLIPVLWPLFERTAYIVKNVVGLVSSLFKQDWQNVFMFALGIVYEFVRPAIVMLQQFAQETVGLMGPVIGAISGGLETISFGLLDDPLGLRTLEDDLDAFADNAGWIDKLDETYRQGLGGIFGPGTIDAAKDAVPDAKEAGGILGGAVQDGVAASSKAPEWAQDWAAQVMSVLEKKIGDIKKSATDALEASHKIAMKVFDDRVKAIDDQQKAEEKLYKTEEYLNKKKEIMQKRQLDSANYAKNRLLAIYEGRFNDVRSMDLEQQVDAADSNKQMGDLEKSRGRDLIAEQRDNLKEQINAEKEAAEEIYQTRKTSIESQIDLITQYTPATVEGLQTMMDQLNTVLLDNGVDSWPGKTQTAMDIMKEVFLTANKNVIQEFIASGKSQMTDWMAAFAEPVTVTILMKKSEQSDTGGLETPDIGKSSGPTKLPENFATDIVQASKDFLRGNMTEGGKRMNDIFQGLLAKGDQKAIDKFLRDAEKLAGAPKGVTPIPTPEEKKVSGEQEIAREMAPDKPPSTLANVGALATAGAIIGTAVPLPGATLVGGIIGGTVGLLKSLFESTGKKSAKDIVEELKSKNIEITPNLIEEFKKRGYDITGEVEKAAQATGAAWNGAGEKVDAVFTGVQGNYRTAAAGIAADTVVYTDDLGNTWTETTTGLANQFGVAGSVIKNESGEITGIMNFNTGEVSTKFTQTTAGMQQDMITAASVINGTDFSGAKSSTDGIGSNFLGMIFGPIGLLASWAGFSNVLSTPIKFATNIFSGLWTMFSSVMGDIWTSIKNVPVLGSLASGIESGVKAIGGAIGGVFGLATGGYVKAKPGGSLVNIAEGGFDEFVISTDPKYRASNMAYLASAASKMGMSSALGVASRGAGRMTSGSMDMKSYSGASNISGGDTYISVDTFIGEEQWFASMASKYNMKTIPRDRKVAGQQKRVISSYNDRYSIK
jgi:TP901 family phage tail tape measure protein